MNDKNLDKCFYVYLHKKPDGTVFYVGKGKGRRAWSRQNRNIHWHRTVNKHGGYSVEILEDCLCEDEALCLEVETIDTFGLDNLTNLALGGSGVSGMVHSEETRAQMSESHKKRYRERPEELQRSIDALRKVHERVRNNKEDRDALSKRVSEWWKTAPKEVLERLSEVRAKNAKRMWQDENKRKEISDAIKKAHNKMSDETKQVKSVKISFACKNRYENLDEAGRKIFAENAKYMKTPEAIAKYKEARQRKLVINRKFIVESLAEYSRQLGKRVGKLKLSEDGYIIDHGYFIEDYDSVLHKDAVEVSSLDSIPLLFPTDKNSKPVSNSAGDVYLSLHEAASSIKTPAKMITKQTSITSARTEEVIAYGLKWFHPTKDEVKNEVFNRLYLFLKENNDN